MRFRLRRLVLSLVGLVGLAVIILVAMPPVVETPVTEPVLVNSSSEPLAQASLAELLVKEAGPSDGYSRDQFGNGWASVKGCQTREIILYRDLQATELDDSCHVIKGTLNDPYTGLVIEFTRGAGSARIQIDHVVALSDAWKKGAALLSREQRMQLANDPLELLAVDGQANQDKSDSDAANWLPPAKAFHCRYVARQIAIKLKYMLWVSLPEAQVMQKVLSTCPEERLPAQ